MSLTLCALPAIPFDFSELSSSSTTLPPSTTPLSSSLPSGESNGHGKGLDHKSHIGMIAGMISRAVIALIILFVCIIWWKRKRARQDTVEKRSSSMGTLLPFVFNPVVGFIDIEKRDSTVAPSSSASVSPLPTSATAPSDMLTAPPVGHELDEHNRPRTTESRSNSSPLEPRPPSHHTTGSLLNS